MATTFRDYGDSRSGTRKKHLKNFVRNVNKRCDGMKAEINDGKMKIKNGK